MLMLEDPITNFSLRPLSRYSFIPVSREHVRVLALLVQLPHPSQECELHAVDDVEQHRVSAVVCFFTRYTRSPSAVSVFVMSTFSKCAS